MNNHNISIIIPCRNEAKFIDKCLDSIIANDFPKDRLEVIIVDGMSDDGTLALIEKYVDAYPFIRLLSNNKKITPVGMNIGIKAACGNYIIILSSHSTVAKDFIRKNIETINQYDADCVGGIMITLPANDTVVARSIAIAISHPFGVGNAYFRTGAKKVRYVDTVPFGCYKKRIFEKVGLFDESLVRNQDDEINFRLIKRNLKILLNPSIVSRYYARDSVIKLWRMYFQYGQFKPLVAVKIRGVMTWRQLIPAIFVSGMIGLSILSLISQYMFFLLLVYICLYLSVNMITSLIISFTNGMRTLLFLPITFLTIHIGYGSGYLKGIWDFIIRAKHRNKELRNVHITR